MRPALLAFLIATIAAFGFGEPVQAATKVTVGVLKFGTVSWVLDTIQKNGLDKAEGFELDVVPLASTEATAVGLQGGSVDIIATDWLWVSRERSGGADFTFSPFTTALGAIMVPPNSPIKTLTDLKGKKLGVAGGPLDKSWLLIVAYALRTANLDLRTETTQVFGAPPLLAEKAKQGEIDAVLNFWPYAARLEAAGFKQLIGIEDVVSELGAKGEVAMVGYVFSESWANDNLKAVDGFLRAAAKADELLATSNEAWEAIRPLMRAEDQATFEALRRRYREGIPERSVAENEFRRQGALSILARAWRGEACRARRRARPRHLLERRQVLSVSAAPPDTLTGLRGLRGPIVSVLSVAGFLLVWFIAAEIAQSRLLPGPVEVLSYVVDEALHGDLLAELGITLWRVTASFVVAMAIGSVIGVAMGELPALNRALDPMADRAFEPARPRHHHPRLCLVRAERGRGNRRRRPEQDPERHRHHARGRKSARPRARRDGARLSPVVLEQAPQRHPAAASALFRRRLPLRYLIDLEDCFGGGATWAPEWRRLRAPSKLPTFQRDGHPRLYRCLRHRHARNRIFAGAAP